MNVLGIFEEFFTLVSVEFGIDKTKIKDVCTVSQKSKPLKGTTTIGQKGLSVLEQAKLFANLEFGVQAPTTTTTEPLTLVKLREMCREKGLKISGTKEELKTRLSTPTPAPSTAVGTKKKMIRKKKTLFNPRDVSQIIEKLQGPVSKLAIRKNDSGYYTDVNSGLVFDPETHRVIGIWKDGNVKFLVKEDIERCVELGVKYDLPENLDLGNVKIFDKVLQEVLEGDDFKEGYDEDTEEDDEGSEDESD